MQIRANAMHNFEARLKNLADKGFSRYLISHESRRTSVLNSPSQRLRSSSFLPVGLSLVQRGSEAPLWRFTEISPPTHSIPLSIPELALLPPARQDKCLHFQSSPRNIYINCRLYSSLHGSMFTESETSEVGRGL